MYVIVSLMLSKPLLFVFFQSRKHYVHKALCVASACFLYMLLPLVKKEESYLKMAKDKR